MERYNPTTCSSFTSARAIGISLHEMHEVSGLPLGDFPYEEHVPTASELTLLEEKNPELVKIYWELMCYFFICRDSRNRIKRKGVLQLDWVKYLFPNVEEGVVDHLSPSPDSDISARLKRSSYPASLLL